MPFAQEIDLLRRQESEVLQEINYAQSELNFMMTEEDY